VEKRQHPRITCRIDCKLRIAQQEVAAVVRNISEGGLSVYADVPPPEQGEAAYLTLQPGRGAEIDLETLVWHSKRLRKVSTGESMTQFGLVLASGSEPFFELLRSLRKRTGAASARAPDRVEPPRAQPVAPVSPPEPEPLTEPEPRPELEPLTEPEPPPELELEPLHQYAIRVKQDGGSRSCNVVVGAESVEDAKERALAEIGEGWTILEVKML